MLTNLPLQREENTQSLDKLADDAQQHAATLRSLGVIVSSEMLVHLVGTKLHQKTAERWEVSLKRDEVPGIDRMRDFLYKIAACVSKRSRVESGGQDQARKGQPIEKTIAHCVKIFNINFTDAISSRLCPCRTESS